MRAWLIFVVRRVLLLGVALFGVVAFTFFATRKVGSPIYLMVGTEFTKEMLESAAQRIGADKPLLVQFKNYLVNLLHGNLGVSRFTFNPVTVDLKKKIPATIELALFSFLLIVLWSVPMGILSGVKKNSHVDRAIRSISNVGVAVAQFWLGLMLIYVFFFLLRWFPAPMGRISPLISPPRHITGLYILDSLFTGNWRALFSSFSQIFLPAVTLAITISPYILFMVRAATISILDSDYILNARAFGLSPLTIGRYLAKNIVPPVSTILGLNLALLFGGAVLVEIVFSWPGVGQYAVNAMHLSDYDPVIAVVLISAVILSGMYFIVDIINAIIDPRWRLS